MLDITKIAFYSDANYMKRISAFTSSATVTLGAHGAVNTQTVSHVLGYIPYFEVFAEVDGDGVIWAGEKIDQYTESSLGGVEPASPILDYWSSTTALTIRLDNTTTPTATGTRTLYWVVYIDYGNV